MTASFIDAAVETPGGTANRRDPRASGALPVVARRLALPGRLRKQFRVPEGHAAIVLAEAGPYTLGPGEHSLSNWPAPAAEVILVNCGRLPLDLQWDGLLAGDGEPVALVLSGEVAVPEPLRLHETWLRLSPGPEWLLPADAVAGRLHAVASECVAQYALADLARPAVRESLVRALREPLGRELGRYGLAPADPGLAVQAVSRAAQEAAARDAAAAAELARDAAMAQAFSQLDTRDMFLDRLATWEAQTGEQLDPATAERLWHQVAPDGLPLRRQEEVEAALAEAAGELAAEAAQQGVEPLPVDRRQEQMLARLDAPAASLPETPSQRLNRIYSTLRLGAASVGCAWAVRSVFANGFAQADVAGLALEGLGLVVAVVGVGAAAVTYRQAQTRAAPYWLAVQDRIAGLPAAAALAEARAHARRSYLAADVLIIAALLVGLLLWLGSAPRGWVVLPLLAFTAAFGLVLAGRSRERQARREVEALTQSVVHPTLPERRTADDLVRRRVAEYLGRTATNLEEAGGKLYRLGPAGQDVSTALRKLRTGPLARLREEAQRVHYQDARYFASAWVPEEQVNQMLDLDDDLLRRAQQLALDSEALYAASTDGSADGCAAAAPTLDKDINQLRRVLGERSAFIETT